MLAIDDRREILDRFLKREEVKKEREDKKTRIEECRATKEDVQWMIGEKCEDMKNKEKLIHALLKKTPEWMEILYRGGYVYPVDMDRRMVSKYLEERKDNVKRRYQTWKKLRLYFASKGVTEDEHMYPQFKHSIYQFICDDDKLRVKACNLFLMMIVNYIPLYNVYMYDPVPEANYGSRYYSGEPIIVYYLTKKMAEDRHYRMRVRRAISAKEWNGYSLENVYKLVICNFDWKVLDDQRGTGSFKRFVINPYQGNIYQRCLLYWKDYTGEERFFSRYDVLNYAACERVLPWPYYKKDGKLELLDCVKELDLEIS